MCGRVPIDSTAHTQSFLSLHTEEYQTPLGWLGYPQTRKHDASPRRGRARLATWSCGTARRRCCASNLLARTGSSSSSSGSRQYGQSDASTRQRTTIRGGLEHERLTAAAVRQEYRRAATICPWGGTVESAGGGGAAVDRLPILPATHPDESEQRGDVDANVSARLEAVVRRVPCNEELCADRLGPRPQRHRHSVRLGLHLPCLRPVLGRLV